MVMKHLKYIFSSLKNDFSKLFAIVLIVLLGIGFMSGLLQAGEDLKGGQNLFYKQNLNSDIRMSFSGGISKDSYNLIKDNIRPYAISPEFSKETNVKSSATTSYSLVYYRNLSLSSPDNLVLVEGKLPEEKNECVILTGNSNFSNFNIGDNFSIENDDILYTIVGKVQSSEYLTKQIVTSLTSGRRLQSIIYFDIQQHDEIKYYTSINFCFNIGASRFSERYFQKVKEYQDKINNFIDENDLINISFKEIIKEEVIKTTDEYLKNFLGTNAFLEFKDTADYQKMIEENIDKAFYSYIKENGDLTSFYITLNENYSYIMLKQDIDKVTAVAKIFPAFFFLIAMLVASSSISRIIAKDRLVMGTFKGLGMKEEKISSKYFIYGLIAILIGSIIGLILGLRVLTWVIYYCYISIYYLPIMIYWIDVPMVLFIILLMTIFIFGVIFFYCWYTLKEKPVDLMKEKAPKPGKKILLERIRPIWKILPFSIKNMFRNVFRYKKNLFMMLIGVGGSVALFLAAFGMKDSITVLTKKQYTDIFHYNYIIETTNYQKIENNFDNKIEIGYYSGAKIDDQTSYNFNILCGDNLDKFISFNNDFLNSSVIVTTDLASHYNLEIGKDFTFKLNNNEYSLTLSDITNNYVGNYLYLGSDYSETFKNNALLGYKEIENSEVDAFTEMLFKNGDVQNIIYTGDSLSVYDSLLNNLNMIVLIIIILSGLLMITVIYNLVDINISSRKKEIATLKVLGYHRLELIMYIFREILLMTILSIILGLVAGYYLHSFIIMAICSPGLIFGRKIFFNSYIYAILLTCLFSLIVTAMLSPKILKIDMVESLKSVD